MHGNTTAWRAVLAQLRRIQIVHCLGDLAGKGPDGVGVTDLCEDVCAGVVRGNWDSAMVDTARDEPWLRRHRCRLGSTCSPCRPSWTRCSPKPTSPGTSVRPQTSWCTLGSSQPDGFGLEFRWVGYDIVG